MVVAYDGDGVPEGWTEVEAPVAGGTDISTIVDLLYPIGRGFLDFTDTDYSNWLGLTWERELVGMTPIGKDENDTDYATVGAIGGKKTLTLKKENLPNYTLYNASHAHTQAGHSHTTTHYCGVYTTGSSSGTGTINSLKSGSYVNYSTNSVQPAINGTTITVNSGGSGKAFDVMQKSLVCNYIIKVSNGDTPLDEQETVSLISFTIDGTSYQAEEGMTWYDWCNSNYNTSTWVCTSSTQTRIPPEGGNGEDYLALQAGYKTTACVASDVIIANHAYGTGSSSK